MTGFFHVNMGDQLYFTLNWATCSPSTFADPWSQMTVTLMPPSSAALLTGLTNNAIVPDGGSFAFAPQLNPGSLTTFDDAGRVVVASDAFVAWSLSQTIRHTCSEVGGGICE